MIYLLVAAELLVWANYSRRHVPMLGICCLVFTQTGTYDPRIPWAVVIEEGGVLRVAMRYSDDSERFNKDPRPGESERAELFCVPVEQSFGLFAPIVVSRNHWISLRNDGVPFTAAEYSFVRAKYADALQQDTGGRLPTEYFKRLAAGDGTYRTVSYGWMIHDVLVLSLLGLALRSSALSWSASREARRRAARAEVTARGVCPGCGYRIAEIMRAGKDTCPECGEKLETGSADQERPTV